MADLVNVVNIKKYFPVDRTLFGRVLTQVHAVDNVSFTIQQGETVGLVGESGCGKTTIGRLILHLLEPTAGEVFFNGQKLSALTKKDLRQLRREMQIIFQDPYSSLNPRMTVGQIVAEPLLRHRLARGKASKDKVAELLSLVGLDPNYMRRFPHEFSGGQRQRIGIARALATRPKLIVCDEPVSALDVSIQSQVLNLLKDLQAGFGLTYLFIAHGLNVVKHVSDRVGVMYLGKMVELTGGDELYGNPLHPYTKALLSAIPEPDPKAKKERIILTGDVPSPINPPAGCRFHTRCPQVMEVCRHQPPEFREVRTGHWVACHLLDGNP
ncbi:MAG: ABC transporter ATP-binding protein [Bacillota bacterium]